MSDESVTSIGARQALYALLARLFLAPPDAGLIAELRALPGLAEHLAESSDLQPLAVAHEQIFGRNVYPYESLFRDRELMLNTAAADRVAELYAACGFAPGAGAAAAPDHLGLELGLMAHLLRLERAALDRQDDQARSWARAQQGRCLHDHLALWAPAGLAAVARVATHPLYLVAAQLTLELLLSDLGRVAAPMPTIILGAAPPAMPPPPAPMPDPEPPTDEGAGINQLVRRLITPDEVGVFLSRGDLSALGRQLGLPVPIGDRFQMLRGLFEHAGQFELVAPLLEALDSLLSAQAGQIEVLAGDYPAWGAGAAHWRERISHGRALLDELRAQLPAGPWEPAAAQASSDG